MDQVRLLISYFLISFIVAGCAGGTKSKDDTIDEEKKVFNCVVDFLDKELLKDVPYSINPTLYELADTALLRERIMQGLDSMFTSEDLDRMINQYEMKKIDWVKKYLDSEYYGKIDAKYDERCMTIFSPPLIKDEDIAIVVVSINEFVSEKEYALDDVLFVCIKSNEEWAVDMYAVMQ
jgi:hypothetical protein